MVRDESLAEPDTNAVAQAAQKAEGRRVINVKPIPKGINAIYRVTFADDDIAVLKAATFNTTGELRPEPHLLTALARETTVPVPEVLAVVENSGSLDTFHFLLEHCEGWQTRKLDRLSAVEQERLVREAGRYLARLHEYRPAKACGPLRLTDQGAKTSREFTTGTTHNSWATTFSSLAAHPIQLLKQVQCGDDTGRFTDLVPDVVAAFESVADAIEEPEMPTLLHRDFHLDNFILASEGTNLRIQSVLDFGDPYIGDYRLDLAFAEDAIIRVQLPTSDRAARLAELFRSTYACERGIDSEEIVNENYAYYLMVQRCRWMAVAMKWEEYDDPEAVEQAYRSFVSECLAQVG